MEHSGLVGLQLLFVLGWLLPIALAVWVMLTLNGMRRALEAIAGELRSIDAKLGAPGRHEI